MTPVEARDELLAQHRRLRQLFREADQVRDLEGWLRIVSLAFEEHNRSEEKVLGPMLAATGEWGQARIDRMLLEHAEEHAAFLAFFALPLDDVRKGLADFIEEVEAHMEAEERVFLNPAILRERRL